MTSNKPAVMIRAQLQSIIWQRNTTASTHTSTALLYIALATRLGHGVSSFMHWHRRSCLLRETYYHWNDGRLLCRNSAEIYARDILTCLHVVTVLIFSVHAVLRRARRVVVMLTRTRHGFAPASQVAQVEAHPLRTVVLSNPPNNKTSFENPSSLSQRPTASREILTPLAASPHPQGPHYEVSKRCC